MEYILIFISAIFVNNIVLSQFLGICPFLGVSQKVTTSLGMGAAVAFVLTLATIVTYLVQIFILNPFGLQYLQTIAFILVIASLVQMVEIILKKVSPASSRHFSSSDNNKLCCSWRCNTRYTTRLFSYSKCSLCIFYSYWIWTCIDRICRYT